MKRALLLCMGLLASFAYADQPYLVPIFPANPGYAYGMNGTPYLYPSPTLAWPVPLYSATPIPVPNPVPNPAPSTPPATISTPVTPASVTAPVPAMPISPQLPLLAVPAPAANTQTSNPWLQNVSPPMLGFNPFTAANPAQKPPLKPYTMRRLIAPQEKAQMMQLMMPLMTNLMHIDMAEAMNIFARKLKAKPGLSFDDVRDSLFLRANQLNMKKVGDNLMWKDFHAVLDDKAAPRIEVYSFCDIAVGRDLLKISPEMIVFLPCRIAIMEDSDKNIWVLTIDWDMDWIKGFEKQLGLSDELIKGALSINSRMNEMMQAAANGDL